ncbi:GNAT family N-acetyltransferase, partial [Streptomyces sp. NPDC048279]|uniref:GNAT family N-acetyltransferase n=1 Tax=Streptomyces sp. NPDC048279 TaxID=3154714 RepID=UPI003435CF16
MPIRAATAADWPQIWPFWHRIVAAAETYGWDPDTSEEAARALWMSPAKRVYVAEDATGAVVGSAYLTPNYGGPAAGVANAGFMVDPDRAGQGIGRALAEHVLAEARAHGYRSMVFNAVVEQPRRSSFQRIGVVHGEAWTCLELAVVDAGNSRTQQAL